MSVAFESREVAAGFKGRGTEAVPTAYVSVTAYLRPGEGRSGGGGGDCRKGEEEQEEAAAAGKNGLILGIRRRNRVEESESAAAEEEGESSESSSIGEESSLSLSSFTADGRGGEEGEEEEEEEEEVQSKLKRDPLGSLDSLEDSLPIKRGLSSHFSGKSKSFASLSDAALQASSARDLAKPENPFNKRRRILMACKKASWPRRASCGSLLHPLTSPAAALLEEVDEEEEDDSSLSAPAVFPPPHQGRRECRAFRSPRSFSLTDLQHA